MKAILFTPRLAIATYVIALVFAILHIRQLSRDEGAIPHVATNFILPVGIILKIRKKKRQPDLTLSNL